MESVSRFDQDFEQIKYIGAGSNGCIYECVRKFGNQKHAVKRILFEEVDAENTFREAQMLARLDHPHVVRYYQAWVELRSSYDEKSDSYIDSTEQTKCMCLQTQACASDIGSLLKKGESMNKSTICLYFMQVLKGLEHIHLQRICHLGLKPENILLGEDGNIRIGDFGLAKYSKRFHPNFVDHVAYVHGAVGVLGYTAPELNLEQPIISTAADIYSAGLLLFEMLFPEKDVKKKMDNFEALKECQAIPPDWPDYHPLILWMTSKSPFDRPTASTAIEMFEELCQRSNDSN